jgi:hypothetical protein
VPSSSRINDEDSPDLMDLTHLHGEKSVVHDGQRVRGFDPHPYVREPISANITIERFIRVHFCAYFEIILGKLGYIIKISLFGTLGGHVRHENLNLQPGEWIQMKTSKEIAAMLPPSGRERGLWSDGDTPLLMHEDGADVLNQITEYYAPEYVRNRCGNVLVLGVAWLVEVWGISEKDRSYKDFDLVKFDN